MEGLSVLCLPYGALGRGVASVTKCFKDGQGTEGWMGILLLLSARGSRLQC